MSMTQQEIENFAQFARQRLDQESSALSLEECLRKWREEIEKAEAIDDVRQGMADHAAGLAEPLQRTFESILERGSELVARARERNAGAPDDEIEREVDAAVNEVRARSQR